MALVPLLQSNDIEVVETLKVTDALRARVPEDSLPRYARMFTGYNASTTVQELSIDAIVEQSKLDGVYAIDVLTDAGMPKSDASAELHRYRDREYRRSLVSKLDTSEQLNGSADGATPEQAGDEDEDAHEQTIITPQQALDIVIRESARNSEFRATLRTTVVDNPATGIQTYVDADTPKRKLKEAEEGTIATRLTIECDPYDVLIKCNTSQQQNEWVKRAYKEGAECKLPTLPLSL